MNWLKRAAKTIGYGAVGGACGGIGAWMFFAIWTAVFGGVPLKHAWRYAQDDPSTNLLGTALVVAATVAGLGIGLFKGARGRGDSS